MKKLVVSLSLLCVALLSCGPKSDQEIVRASAQKYYNYLIKGDVDAYLQGINGYSSLPEDYQGELRDAYLQFVGREQAAHGGLVSATANNVEFYGTSEACVFVDVVYADSLQEQVGLRLVLRDNKWLIKY